MSAGAKIVFLNRFYSPDHSATSQILTDLASSLVGEGKRVCVVTSPQKYEDPNALAVGVELLAGVVVYRVRSSRFGRSTLLGRAVDYVSFQIAAALRLLWLLEPGDIVVAKTDPPMLSVPVALVAWLRGAKAVNWLQDLFPEVATALGHSVAKGGFGRLLRRLRNMSLRRAERNVAIGELMRQRLIADGIDSAKIEVIPNWADGVAIRPVDAIENAVRKDWGVERRFIVGYSGNMGRAHDFSTVLEAATILRGDSRITFLFVGGGAQRAWVERAALERGFKSFVFKPYAPQEALSNSLSAADVHLVSLRPELEGYIVPSKFYGIAAAGRPTIFIGDPNGEIASVLRDLDCGLCVSQGDARGLAQAIQSLCDDSKLRMHLGQNARRGFDERYDKSIAMRKWLKMLGEIT